MEHENEGPSGRSARDLPELCIVEDIAEFLKLSRSRARVLITSGACGPYSKLGRRLVVRRDAFLAHLRSIEMDGVRHPPRTARKRYVEMLKD